MPCNTTSRGCNVYLFTEQLVNYMRSIQIISLLNALQKPHAISLATNYFNRLLFYENTAIDTHILAAGMQ